MLVLGGKTFTLEGVTVFADHADGNQFWYLPAPVVIATRGDDPEPLFTFLRWRPAVAAAGEKGGGFLMLSVALRPPAATLDKVRAQIAALFPSATAARLSPAPFVDGSVQCLAIDLRGATGATAAAPAPGAFQMVEKILGSAMPTLDGDEQASFGLTLSQEGAVLLDRAFIDDAAAIGALYTLEYAGLRPSLDVRITADLKQVYQALSARLDGTVAWLTADVEVALSKLVESGAIAIQVVNPVNDDDSKRKEQQALQLFEQQLFQDWFRPTLAPAPAPAAPDAPAPPRGLALRLRTVSEDEQKTLTVEYHDSEAVRRTHTVPSYFSVLTRGLDRAKHFRDIDLDDPFFRVLDVTITPPRDFTGIGLANAIVGIDYGGDHNDFLFTPQSHERATWQAFRNPRDGSAFSYTVSYTFDPASDWEGEKLSYQVASQRTEDRLLYVNPFESLGFFAVQLTPGRIDWSVIELIEVTLQYQSATGWRSEKHLVLRADSQPQAWKLRLTDKHDDAFTWRLAYRLKSGARLERPAVTSRTPAILVEDPFVDRLDVVFQPMLDAAKTKSAYIDTSYEDPDRGYLSEGHVTVNAGGTAEHVTIPIFDAAKRRFKYRVTLVGPQGDTRPGAWVESKETLLLVTDAGVR